MDRKEAHQEGACGCSGGDLHDREHVPSSPHPQTQKRGILFFKAREMAGSLRWEHMECVRPEDKGMGEEEDGTTGHAGGGGPPPAYPVAVVTPQRRQRRTFILCTVCALLTYRTKEEMDDDRDGHPLHLPVMAGEQIDHR